MVEVEIHKRDFTAHNYVGDPQIINVVDSVLFTKDNLANLTDYKLDHAIGAAVEKVDDRLEENSQQMKDLLVDTMPKLQFIKMFKEYKQLKARKADLKSKRETLLGDEVREMQMMLEAENHHYLTLGEKQAILEELGFVVSEQMPEGLFMKSIIPDEELLARASQYLSNLNEELDRAVGYSKWIDGVDAPTSQDCVSSHDEPEGM